MNITAKLNGSKVKVTRTPIREPHAPGFYVQVERRDDASQAMGSQVVRIVDSF